ncbi:hypothetical protein OPU71_05860 [Niveibacterium sp. 24ML]|uniref:hypothetical protein n=1 Tax=Niveibacterium sp. 24ML TaxID=2985512 RepID=UPI0022706500|nr:hypothetical protein [Niveibacterium sp. 24ML]MCX9155648.1 hypothetical protein [Niveibacterium sp. 24ML]
MKIKLILLAGCLGYGIWFAAVGGKRITQEHVAAIYHEYASAYDRGDGKAVCDLFSDGVHGKFSSTARSMPVNEVVTKASVCSSVDDFYRSKAVLEEQVGHELFTNIEYTIKSISIAPDEKSATAEVLMEFRIGTEQGSLLDMRSTQVDVIKRNFGKTRFTQSDGSVSFYR